MTSLARLKEIMLANPAVRAEYDRLGREEFARNPPADDGDGSDDHLCDKCGAVMDFAKAIGWYCPSSGCSILHSMKQDPGRPDFLVDDEDWEEPEEEDWGTFDERLIRVEHLASQAVFAIGNLVGEINRLDAERRPWWRKLFS